MNSYKPLSHLLLILLTSTLCANIAGEALRIILVFVAGPDTIVERALLQYAAFSIGPHMFNLIILSFQSLVHYNMLHDVPNTHSHN